MTPAQYRKANLEKFRGYKRKYRAKRLRLLHRYKRIKGCADCGYNENPIALEFDHVRGVKLLQISIMTDYTLTKVKAEIAKCEVVCSNCHQIRTYERRRNGIN